MTTLRPERPADGPMSYEDTGQFAAVVQQLDDPLNDPLPGRPPVVREEPPDLPAEPPELPEPPEAPEPPALPEFPKLPDDENEERGPSAVPEVRERPAPQAQRREPPAPFYARPFVTDVPSAPSGASPWFGSAAGAPEAFAPPEPVRPAVHELPENVPPAAFQPPETVPDVPPEAFEPPETVRRRRALRQDPDLDLAATTQLPVVRMPPPAATRPAAEPAEEPVADPARVDPASPASPVDPVGPVESTPLLAGGEDAATPTSPSEDGGRAARRKAARQGGGHRARGRTAGPADASPAEPSAPLSRIEARRAAKAAKDSPSVVISRVVGELFITTGVIMLLFVTYQLWWTNVRAHQQANSASNKLEQQWDTGTSDPSRAAGTFSAGQGFAIMYIPKLDVKAPIAQGVDKGSVLDKGMIGHYDGSLATAMPWDKTGNFAVAAHRNTHGEPFRYINHLVPGDKVVVETATTYYTYEITSSLASTPPSNISVLQPVPTGSGFTKPGRYLTLTTCTPEFTSTNRLIVWGKLTEERPRSKGKPDALVGG